jgi:transposase
MQVTNNQPKLFIGIDIHKKSWRIHTATDLFDGRSLTVPPNAHALREYVEKHFPDHEVSCAYEAGCCGYSYHRAFRSFGWHSVVFNPADISRTGKAQYQKTDKIDARLICRELKDGRLTSITIPDEKREHLRSLFRRRNELAKELRRIKSRIKAQLVFSGIEIPKAFDNDNWSHAFCNWINNQSFAHETMDVTVKSRIAHLNYLDQAQREVSNALRQYCRKHYKKDYQLLRSIPGIGGIVACAILSELGDLRRFNNFKQLAAYIGLIPGMYQSGDSKTTNKGLNPRGHRLMRSFFVEAAWQALRFDPVMQEYYRSHKGKDSKAIIVKIARKLLSRTLAVIKTETPYETGVVA